MAYGLQIKTTQGDVNVLSFRCARLRQKNILTSSSGTVSAPTFNSNNGFVYIKANDGGPVASFSWDNTSKVFSFEPFSGTSTPSENMTVFFMVTT